MPTQSIQVYQFLAKYENVYDSVAFADPRTGEPRMRAVLVPDKKREVHWVEYGPLGSDKTRNWEKVDRLRAVQDMGDAQRNPAILQAAARWAQIEPLYENWKRGQDPTVDGTPLAAWNGIGREQAEVLKMRGIHSVQQLASLNDSHYERFGIPGIRALADNARRYLSTLDNSVLAEQMAQKDEEIANLTDTVEEMRRMLGELMAKQQAPVDFDPPDGFVDPTAEAEPAQPKRSRKAA